MAVRADCLPSSDQDQREADERAAGDAGEQQPSSCRELEDQRDGNQNERQAWDADDLDGREVDRNLPKLLAH